ncbi:MAG: hypothetical protein ACI835_000582 [Planctomycetota bacterium]|jgi:hypothetical protein
MRAARAGDDDEIVRDLDVLTDVVDADVRAFFFISELGGKGRKLSRFDDRSPLSIPGTGADFLGL